MKTWATGTDPEVDEDLDWLVEAREEAEGQ